MREYPENMNLKTAAKYLGVPAATVQRLLENYEIPAAKIGRHWLFKKSVIDEWLAMNSWSHLRARPSQKKKSIATANSVHPSVARLRASLAKADFSGLDPADWDDAQKVIAEERAKSMERIEKIAQWAESDE
jgi:excisionase family DNA binding protein